MNRRGKRAKPLSPPAADHPKRLRRPSASDAADDEGVQKRGPSSSLVVVTGLPADCTVLELKSRLEMYGPISRIRIDADDSGYVTFRSASSAEAAVSAAVHPDYGILVRSQRVQVSQGTDPLVQWRIGVRISSPSRLVRPEVPLSKYGRSNRKLNAGSASVKGAPDLSCKNREIVAYDDIF